MSFLPLRWTSSRLVGLLLALVLTACGGGSPPSPPDILLAVNDRNMTVVQGQQVILELSVIRMNGAVPVQLVGEGLPAGVGLVFTKNPLEDRTTAVLSVGMNVASGTYPFEVLGTAGPVSKALPLRLTVVRPVDVTPPSATLTVTPAQVNAPQTITLSADAKDDQGVARVEFIKNGVLIGSLTKAPWTLTTDVTAADNGTLTFFAHVIDTSGNVANSALVKINVLIDQTSPVVTIGSGTTTDVPMYHLSGGATDDIGVQSLSYTLNGGQPVPLPLIDDLYDVDLTLQEGENFITVLAHDAGGHVGFASLNVMYTLPDTTPPTITLASGHPSSITTSGPVTLTADAHDNRAVQYVSFYDDRDAWNPLVKTVSAAPYTYTFDAFSLSNGVHTFRAVAWDAAYLQTSASVDVIVDIERTPPDVKINSKLYVTDGAYTLTGTATDASGIASVRLKNRSSQTDLGEVSLNGNQFSLPLTLPIGYTYYALTVTDRMGNVGGSEFYLYNSGPDVTAPDLAGLWASEDDVRFAGHIALIAEAHDDRLLKRIDLLRDGAVTESVDMPSPFASCTVSPSGLMGCPFPGGAPKQYHTFWPVLTSADNGPHTFVLRATDAAGHVYEGPAQTVTVNIDAAAPVRPVTAVASGRIYNWNPYRASNVVWRLTNPVTQAQASVGKAAVDASGRFSIPLPSAGSVAPFLAVSSYGPECSTTPTISDPAARFAFATLDAEVPAMFGPPKLTGPTPDGLTRTGDYIYVDRAVSIRGQESCVRNSWTYITQYDLTLSVGWNLVISDDVAVPAGAQQVQKHVSLGTLDGLYWSY